MPRWLSARPPIPSAKACKRPMGKEMDRSRVSDIEEIGGEGVKAVVDGVPVAAGNGKLMRQHGIWKRRSAAAWAPSCMWRWTGRMWAIS